ncbi:aromatic ring-hydroxylating oxygenase subunit alpha [Haloglycomyces albus]|uniref:aromatic ring-hydroxylating oxygenase subunit alpha n=1 Tax=Haloglycomyces albus TaxID=526067 RepID=UPI00046D66D6|nr:SRPBCC family protein [Haloglycomyces albus]
MSVARPQPPEMSPVYPQAGAYPEFADLVNPERCTVDRSVFVDPEVYRAELRQIFARSWLFLAHESQIPKPGDFVRTRMGEDDVIVVRQRDKSVRALVNSCPHRGNRVCMADAGEKARGFICNYHGWSFGLDGRLRGTDGGVYDTDPDFEATGIGLTPVAQVDEYKGLIFGTFDPDAPSLAEWFGPFTYYLDVMLDNEEGGTEFIGGAIRSQMRANWKFPAENFVGDILHAYWTHQSGASAVLGGGVELGKHYEERAFHASVFGHGIETNQDKVGNTRTLGYDALTQYVFDRYEARRERLGEVRARMVGAVSSCNVFPNFSFLPGQASFRVWQPTGPNSIELYTWTLVNKNMPEEIKELYRKGTMMTFSPGGIFEMDDGENWEYCTGQNQGFVTRHQPLHYGLGLRSAETDPQLPGHVYRGSLNDANQRMFYQRWREFMMYDNWEDLQKAPSAPPGGRS